MALRKPGVYFYNVGEVCKIEEVRRPAPGAYVTEPAVYATEPAVYATEPGAYVTEPAAQARKITNEPCLRFGLCVLRGKYRRLKNVRH